MDDRQTRPPDYDHSAAMFKTLADPNRLRILDVLMQGVSCNCELNERLGLPANLLSHHLRVLKEAGLVSNRRDRLDGRRIYYAVNSEAVLQWRAWVSNFFDTTRLKDRPLCGPEGQQAAEITVYPQVSK